MRGVSYEPPIQSKEDFTKMVDDFLSTEEHCDFLPPVDPERDWTVRQNPKFVGRMLNEFMASFEARMAPKRGKRVNQTNNFTGLKSSRQASSVDVASLWQGTSERHNSEKFL